MNIPIKVNKDFEKTIQYLSDKYGEDFDILNGIHESHLNFSDFMDGFIDKNVADVMQVKFFVHRVCLCFILYILSIG